MIRSGAVRMPFRDAMEKSKYAGFEEGKTFVSMWTKQAPGVVDKRLAEAMPNEVYPGAVCIASYSCFAYENSGNKGVSFGLQNVMVVDSTAPRIDGKVAAKDDFDAVGGGEGDDDEDIPF